MISNSNKWLKFVFILVVIAITIFASVPVKALPATGLGCRLLSNCDGSAGCEGAGTVSGCELTCEGGGSVSCSENN